MSKKLGIVIPTYNEHDNIGRLIPHIFQVCRARKIRASVLVVDDNSPDHTGDVVKALSRKYDVRLLTRPRKMGLGTAYVKGFTEIMKRNIDFVMEMDSDMSHDPEHIPRFVSAMDRGFDVAVGSRKIRGGSITGWGLYRKSISALGNAMAKFFTGLHMTDMTSGYRIYKKSVLKSVGLRNVESRGFVFQIEMLYRSKKNGFKIGEVPIAFVDRKLGKSKLSSRDKWEFLKIGIKMRLGMI
jgi:dolichol-phosphate mannosyltransferase